MATATKRAKQAPRRGVAPMAGRIMRPEAQCQGRLPKSIKRYDPGQVSNKARCRSRTGIAKGQESHQAGYPKIASKARDRLTGPQIDGRKIKGLLDYPRRAQRYFWVAVGAII